MINSGRHIKVDQSTSSKIQHTLSSGAGVYLIVSGGQWRKQTLQSQNRKNGLSQARYACAFGRYADTVSTAAVEMKIRASACAPEMRCRQCRFRVEDAYDSPRLNASSRGLQSPRRATRDASSCLRQLWCIEQTPTVDGADRRPSPRWTEGDRAAGETAKRQRRRSLYCR